MNDVETVKEALLCHAAFATQLRCKDVDFEAVIPPLEMGNGQIADIGCIDGNVTTFGDGFSSTVIEPDVQTCNGMTHVVDR